MTDLDWTTILSVWVAIASCRGAGWLLHRRRRKFAPRAGAMLPATSDEGVARSFFQAVRQASTVEEARLIAESALRRL